LDHFSKFNVCAVLGYHRHFESELDAALVEYLQTVPENGGLKPSRTKAGFFRHKTSYLRKVAIKINFDASWSVAACENMSMWLAVMICWWRSVTVV
jgi:hypothetical protein